MSEIFDLTDSIKSSLQIAVRATEQQLDVDALPGLSQFDLATLLSPSKNIDNQVNEESTLTITDELAIIAPYYLDGADTLEVNQDNYFNDVPHSLLNEEGAEQTENNAELEYIAEETEEDNTANTGQEDLVEEISNSKSSRTAMPSWSDIVSGISSTKDDYSALISQPTESIVEEVVEEDSVDTADSIVEEVVEEESSKSEEELWLEETGFGLNDIEVVSSNEDIDYFAGLEEPDTEPSQKINKVSEDQVVLVVEQLVVNPNQATTIQQGGSVQQVSAPNSPISYPQPAQPVFYTPPTAVPQAPIIMPQDASVAVPMEQQAPVVPQRPVYQPPAAPIYQSPAAPAAPAEISVNVAPPAAPMMPPAAQSAPIIESAPTTDVGTDSRGEEIPHYAQTSFQQKEADQIIEIRSDATSISANTVSVESSQPLIPSLANFDPRKYFSPNEMIAPKLEENTGPKQEFPADARQNVEYNPSTGPVRPVVNIPLPQIEDYRPQPVALSSNAEIIVEQGPEDLQKVTQMFKELRRMRDK